MLDYLVSLTKEQWHQKLFIYGLYVSYIIFAEAITGVMYVSPDDLVLLRSMLTYYVWGFILLRFNPFIRRRVVVSKTEAEFERRIVFSSAIFLLLTTSITNLSLAYLKQEIDNRTMATPTYEIWNMNYNHLFFRVPPFTRCERERRRLLVFGTISPLLKNSSKWIMIVLLIILS